MLWYEIFWENGNCDSLKWYLWKQGISTTGLKKSCLVRLSTNVNNISIELKAVRQADSWRSQRQKRRKWWWKRRGTYNKLGKGCGGRGMEKQISWMAEYSSNCHPCQTNQTQKYANTCLVRYENNARRQCHQTKLLQESLRNKRIIWDYIQEKNDRYFLNNLNGTTNSDNPWTANTKTCAVNNVVMNHG